MYTIKTRNWNGNKTVKKLLMLVCNTVDKPDHDTKHMLHTDSFVRAWSTWAYFMLLRRFSGGWTYIIRPGHQLGSGYKAIY